MGLLDQLSYNGDPGGGLLAFLNQLQQGAPPTQMGLPSDQAQYAPQGQPTQGLAPIAQGAMPQNAQPSPLDNAQWPAGPVGAPMQANAQMPPQQAPPVMAAQPLAPQQQPQAQPPGFFDRLNTGLQSMGNGGSLIGALTGHLTDPTSVAKAQQAQVANVTAQALIGKGVPREVAIAAVQPGNTEMLKTLVTQTFGPQTVQSLGNGYIADRNGKVTRAYEPDDKFQHVTVKNADGSESQVTFDPSTGKYSGAPAPAPSRFSVDPNLTGKDRLDALKATDPDYARRIESMVNGDIPLPTGVAALKPNADRMIKDVLAVDGSTSASDFATRAATRKDYASGVASRVTKSINTTIGHFATLDQSIDKLGNYSYFPGISNYVHDKVASNIDPEYQKAKATFETNKEAAIKELDFALSGGHSSVSGSAELRDKFNRADSPEALHAAVTEAMSLLQKRLQSHAKAFSEGTKSQRDEQDFIYPENRTSFNKLLGSEDTSTGQSVPGVSVAAPNPAQGAPKAGNYMWMPGKGLVPKS